MSRFLQLCAVAAVITLGLLTVAYTVIFVPPAVRDLRFENADVVRGEACPLMLDSRSCGDTGRYLRVVVSTSANLKEHADRYELNLWSQAGYCPRVYRYDGDELDDFGPYWRGLRLPMRSNDAEDATYDAQAHPSTDGRYRYEVYIDPVRKDPSFMMAGKRAPPYDLAASGRDVCFVLGGGNMGGGGFRTNKVAVPARLIAEALAEGA